MEGLRAETSVVELCRKHNIAQSAILRMEQRVYGSWKETSQRRCYP